MSEKSKLLEEYIKTLESLAHESQLVREEIKKVITFEHLNQRIHSIQQQLSLIHDTLEPRTFAEKAHMEHLHKTVISLVQHSLTTGKDEYLETLKASGEYWEQVEALIDSILIEIEHLKAAADYETELTPTLSELNEKMQALLETVEKQHGSLPHSAIHTHIEHIKHQLHFLHQPHTKHDHTYEFLEHYHTTIEEIALHMHHLQHRFNEIAAELKDENKELKELEALQEEIERLKAAYEEQLETIKKSAEHHKVLAPGAHFNIKKDP